jgi:hypothetical protein
LFRAGSLEPALNNDDELDLNPNPPVGGWVRPQTSRAGVYSEHEVQWVAKRLSHPLRQFRGLVVRPDYGTDAQG